MAIRPSVIVTVCPGGLIHFEGPAVQSSPPWSSSPVRENYNIYLGPLQLLWEGGYGEEHARVTGGRVQ